MKRKNARRRRAKRIEEAARQESIIRLMVEFSKNPPKTDWDAFLVKAEKVGALELFKKTR